MKKSSEDAKAVKKVKPKLFKPEYRVYFNKILFVLMMILMLFGVLFIIKTGFQINMLVNGDVMLKIEPRNINILTEKRIPQNLSYTIEVENRILCEASCSYTFKDVSKNKIIDQGNFSSKGGTSLTLNYSIEPPKKGTGQLAYEFSSECSNKKTYFCRSDEQSRKKSSFTTLSYQLSTSEKEEIAIIKSNLLNNILNLSLIDIALQNKSYVYSNLDDRLILANFNKIFNILNDYYNILVNDLFDAKKLWDVEDYSSLSVLNKDTLIGINALNDDLSNLNELLNARVELFFKAYNNLESFGTKLNLYDDLMKINAFYEVQTYDYLEDYHLLINDFNNNKSASYPGIITKISKLSQKFDEDYTSKLVRLNDSINKWTYLSKTEYNKTIIQDNNIFITINRLCNLSYEEVIGAEVVNVTNFNKSKDLIDFESTFCDVVFPQSHYYSYDFSLIGLPSYNSKIFETTLSVPLKEHLPICCIFDECEVCCEDESCHDNENNYPIILVHGHALSEEASIENALSEFTEIQKKFILNGFIDAGVILPTNTFVESEKGILGKYGKPVIVETTYYVDSKLFDYDAIFFESNNETIETYAKRLNQTIELVKFKTGASKVNVIAHSMGGLVTRKYLVDSGEKSINKLIMIGTPNNGVEGLVESFCSVTGSFNECDEMTSSSVFINSLNAAYNAPKIAKTYVIYGTGCSLNGADGDGIVSPNSAKLPYSLNFEIKGNCDGTVLHQDLLNVEMYPEVFQTIQNILKN